MCVNLVPTVNPKYRKAIKLGRPLSGYPDDFYLLVPCGKCIDCRRKRGKEWRTRLQHEIMYGDFRTVYFITLTFSPEFYEKFQIEVPGSNSFSKRRVSNDGVSRAVRLFLERYRKRYGRSLRHFFVTERGEKGGRLHLHGLIFDPEFTLHLESSKYSGRVVSKPYDLLQLNKAFAEIWSYGFTYFEPITQKTVNYVTKYITKYYDYDKEFIPKIFVSPGFGSCFCRNRQMVDWTKKISGKDGRFCYVASVRCALPRYYFEKIYNEAERRWIKDSLSGLPPDYSNLRVGLSVTCSQKDYLLESAKRLRESERMGLSQPVFEKPSILYNVENQSFL